MSLELIYLKMRALAEAPRMLLHYTKIDYEDLMPWNFFKNVLTDQKNWERQWRDPEPKKEYDIIIVGGELH